MNFKQEKTSSHATADENNEIDSISSEKRSVNKENVISRLPQRYVIKGSGGTRILTCLEAPDIVVKVEAGLTVSAAAARKCARSVANPEKR